MSKWRLPLLVLLLATATSLFAGDDIPAAAWRRGIGAPLENPGGKKPNLNIIDDGYWQGAPVGGFGAGTFSRTYRGNFERWHVKAGIHKYQNIPANQFAVFEQAEGEPSLAQVLSTQKPEGNDLSAWNWTYPVGAGDYAALYPKSWFAYKSQQLPVSLTVEQFSPILPDNYKESSYPVAVYNWYLTNPSQKRITVSILFSWTNMVGWFRDTTHNFAGGTNAQNINRYKSQQLKGGSMQGIVFDRVRSGGVSEEWDGQFAIAAMGGNGAEVSYLSTYQANGSGSTVWTPFSKDGRLPNADPGVAGSDGPLAGAIAVRVTLAPGEKRTIPMALAWDLPYVEFGLGRKWQRHYTRFFDTSGTNAWKIASLALEQGQDWSRQIDAWQKPYIDDQQKPLWYRGMLFNELYTLADGGALYGHEVGKPGNSNHPSSFKDDSFSFLECFDYPFYGSLDVRFYGSFPLAKFWPEIEKQEIREYADTIPETIQQNYIWAAQTDQEHKIVPTERKVAGSAPHDLGSPLEDPLVLPNQYNFQSVSNWKDLNSKYVLMVWRDYVFSGSNDKAFVQYNYKAVKQAMQFLRQFDKNNDGLIENDGYPDQTYDTWAARGESAYTGSLYLAALRATEEMAKIVGDSKTAQENADLFKRAQASFLKKLWNGKYFNYDVGSPYKDSIMAEQLAGQWYATTTGLGDLVPRDMQRSALKYVYDFDVMKLANGTMGALNGIGGDGELLKDNEQTGEVWTGVTFAVAATMLQSGLQDEAFTTAKGVYNVVYQEKGYWFRTPEAYDVKGFYRAGMYMRPAAIWSMEMLTPAGAPPKGAATAQNH